jgi:predicted permease
VEIVLTVLAIVAPVFLLGSAGFVWSRAGYDYPTEFVTRISMTLAVPCLIFTALMRADIAPATLTALSLAALAAYAVVIALSWGLSAALKLDRAAYVAPLAFGNTGNLGLPLALFAYGETGLGLAVVVFAVMAILTFTIGLWLVSGGASPARVLKEPMLWATILGGLFLTMGWQTPEWLTRSLSLTGQMAIPLMLVTLGVAIARLKPGRIGRAVWLSAAKLALGLVAGVVAARAFGLEPVAFGVLVLQMATPVAVTSYLLAERYNADPDAVAGLVMVSTLMSIAALPVTLSFLL